MATERHTAPEQNLFKRTATGTSNDDNAIAFHQKRQRRFMPLLAKPAAPQIPRAAAVITADKPSGQLLPASRIVCDRLGSPSMIVGFDCETHDWRDNTERKGRIGPFGWYTCNDNVAFARLVQLGWVVADANHNADVISKSSLIQPQGFQITEKAKGWHGIAQKEALQNGRPLADVLEEFMRDVSQACARGGRVCAHQLEFDAGVVDEELARCGLHDLRARWGRIAQSGYCTMNPQVGRWLKQCAGHDVGPETKQHILGLTYTTRLLGLCPDNFRKRYHNAEHDANMARLIYAALLERAKASRITFSATDATPEGIACETAIATRTDGEPAASPAAVRSPTEGKDK